MIEGLARAHAALDGVTHDARACHHLPALDDAPIGPESALTGLEAGDALIDRIQRTARRCATAAEALAKRELAMT